MLSDRWAGWNSITLVDPPHTRAPRSDSADDIDPAHTQTLTDTDPTTASTCHVRVQLFAHINLTIRVDPGSGAFVLQRTDARSMSPRVRDSFVGQTVHREFILAF